ncbi:hypothetical protein ADUPG1_003449, partial [Aduncisulcus paluster]
VTASTSNTFSSSSVTSTSSSLSSKQAKPSKSGKPRYSSPSNDDDIYEYSGEDCEDDSEYSPLERAHRGSRSEYKCGKRQHLSDDDYADCDDDSPRSALHSCHVPSCATSTSTDLSLHGLGSALKGVSTSACRALKHIKDHSFDMSMFPVRKLSSTCSTRCGRDDARSKKEEEDDDCVGPSDDAGSVSLQDI